MYRRGVREMPTQETYQPCYLDYLSASRDISFLPIVPESGKKKKFVGVTSNSTLILHLATLEMLLL